MGDLITVYVKSPSIPVQGVLGDYIDRCITDSVSQFVPPVTDRETEMCSDQLPPTGLSQHTALFHLLIVREVA